MSNTTNLSGLVRIVIEQGQKEKLLWVNGLIDKFLEILPQKYNLQDITEDFFDKEVRKRWWGVDTTWNFSEEKAEAKRMWGTYIYHNSYTYLDDSVPVVRVKRNVVGEKLLELVRLIEVSDELFLNPSMAEILNIVLKGDFSSCEEALKDRVITHETFNPHSK